MKQEVRITEKDGRKRHIGDYDEKRNTFFTIRNGAKHLLKKYNAWGVDRKLIEEFLAPRDAMIIIKDIRSGITYSVTAKEFVELGEQIDYYQHRPQLHLHVDKFIKKRA